MWRGLADFMPRGFHRIRHYGLLASSCGKANLQLDREPTRSHLRHERSLGGTKRLPPGHAHTVADA